MKKILGIALASTLILGACGNDNDKESKEATQKSVKKVDENKPTFENDTLVLDQAVLKIKETFIVHDKDANQDLLAFKFEVKNKSDNKDISALNVWIAAFEAIQDDKNTETKLDVGLTPNTGKYEEWNAHAVDTIKKGGTAKGIITYEIGTKNDVILKATQGVGGKKLGEKRIELSGLKKQEFSLTEDNVK